MKKKILLLLLAVFLIAGCDEKIEEAPKTGVENPILVDEGTKITTIEVDERDDQSTPVESFYIEYFFEKNFCSKIVYHTKYKAASNTEYNLEAVLKDTTGAYSDAYIDDDHYLVYTYLDDGLFGKSYRDVLYYLQFVKGIEVTIE